MQYRNYHDYFILVASFIMSSTNILTLKISKQALGSTVKYHIIQVVAL